MNKITQRFNFNIPPETPIHSIVKDLSDSLLHYSGILSIKEVSGNNSFTLSFESNDSFYVFVVSPSDKIKRNLPGISICIIDAFSEKNGFERNLVESPDKLTFITQPSQSISLYSSSLPVGEKEYAMLISDKTGEINYKIEPAISELRLRTVVRDLINIDPKKEYFLIDSESNVYLSNAFRNLKDALINNNKKLFSTSEFINYSKSDIVNFEREITSILKNSSRKTDLVIFLTSNQYKAIFNTLTSLRKQGYSFKLLSEVI
ncbi:MAG: hypothetical protein IAE91_04830 [Ignavibacteriaceae bacterium]|nr:hypothetical protein [Ignavibacteriaceae bacterium]